MSRVEGWALVAYPAKLRRIADGANAAAIAREFLIFWRPRRESNPLYKDLQSSA